MTGLSIFRTSFIWVQTVPGLLSKTVPAPYAFLGAYGDYAKAFDACQKGTPAAGTLQLPWREEPEGNYYWRYYFEGQDAGAVTGVKAWKKLVPFRRSLAATTVAPQPAEAKVTFEMFYAPQGLALLARANYRGDAKSPLDAAKLALAVRYDYRFLLAGSATPSGGYSLDTIADRAFAETRKTDLGNAEGYSGGGDPVSVTTFLQGEDVQTIAQGSDEHFLLEAVTSWNRTLKTADLAAHKLADAQLTTVRNADAENLMYVRGRGRATWFPRDFVGNARPSLSCYDRNIVQASLQTQSLGAFVTWAAAQLAEGTPLDGAVLDRAKRAAALLQIFSDGGTTGLKVTYRSASVLKQITDAKWSDAIKAIQAVP